ncbi:MAG: phage tail spike protein [Lacticaseibacillus paracasei]
MKDFYFTDRAWHLLGIATAGGGGKIHIVDDTDDQLISAGARTYSGTIRFTPELSSKVQAMAARGNYILYMDERNKAVFMTIMESSHDPLAGEETFTAEDAGIDLINETVGPYKAPQAMGIADYISLFTNDSGFEIGLNEIPNLKRTLEWTGESDTTLNRILSVATQFDNAELDFSFDVSGTTVVRRVINIHKRIGADRNITLYVDKDINKIVTSGSIYDLYTAVTPTGGTPESKDGETTDQQPITLEGYQWTDPDGRYVLTKEGVLLDPVANQTWSRLLAKGGAPSVNAAYINRVVTYTATSQATLLQSALSDLKAHNHEAVNYETDIAVLPQNINIGDTIHLADEDEHLYLSARLLELKSSYSTDTHTATLGDYLIEHDQVAAQYRQLAEQIKNIPKTIQYYPWLRYADDSQGTNMSALPAGKKYMAVVYSNKSSVPSDNPADYAGKWALIQGPKGDTGVGVPGPKGADGKTSYFHTAYANSIDGKQGFSTTDGNGKSYFGQYVDQTQADSTDPTKYSWALFKGTDGRDGKDGSDNVPVITVGAAYPSGPKKGDMHWLTDSSGVVTGYYTYDGTKWNPYKIDAKILSAETFNGLTFNGVTFNGSRFITPFNGHPKTTGGEEDPFQWTRGIISVGDGEVKMTTTSSKTQNGEATATGLVEMTTGLIYSSQQIANSKEKFEATLSPGQLFLSHTANSGGIVSGYIDTELVNELNARGRVIWQGGFYPAGPDTIIPSMKLSQTLTGWLVMWSRFENGVIRNNDYAYSIIPRGLVVYQGLGSNYFRVTATMAGHGTFSKLLWLSDDRIMGDDGNKQGNAAFAVINNVFAI